MGYIPGFAHHPARLYLTRKSNEEGYYSTKTAQIASNALVEKVDDVYIELIDECLHVLIAYRGGFIGHYYLERSISSDDLTEDSLYYLINEVISSLFLIFLLTYVSVLQIMWVVRRRR